MFGSVLEPTHVFIVFPFCLSHSVSMYVCIITRFNTVNFYSPFVSLLSVYFYPSSWQFLRTQNVFSRFIFFHVILFHFFKVFSLSSIVRFFPVICCYTVDPVSGFIMLVPLLFSAVEVTAPPVFPFCLYTFLYRILSLTFIGPSFFSMLTVLRSSLSLSLLQAIDPPGFAASRRTLAALHATQENGLVLINSLWSCLCEPERRRRRDAYK
jgi:hypothetical protein